MRKFYFWHENSITNKYFINLCSKSFFLQAEAKKRKILSVKNVDELTDEKIELYTNRMKETILKERTKAKQ